MTPSIAIVGVGNLLLSDDGAGIHAVHRLQRDAGVGSVARIIDGGTVGPDLLAEVCGCEKLLIVDAVDAGLPPGTTVRMDFSGPDSQKIETRNAHQSGIPGLPRPTASVDVLLSPSKRKAAKVQQNSIQFNSASWKERRFNENSIFLHVLHLCLKAWRRHPAAQ